ncbi:MAG: hypothetical protein LBB59_06605 [Campylobacteraceae bacterium]|nr:hypothetical protein [Campylobacteraceae bacterium]
MKNHNPIPIADIISDPFNFTYGEISGVLGETEAKRLYAFLYKNGGEIKVRSIWIKNIVKDSKTEKYLFGFFDDRYIESVCIRRRTGVSACVSVQVGCPVRRFFCDRCFFRHSRESGNPKRKTKNRNKIIKLLIFIFFRH